MPALTDVYADVYNERLRQDERCGEQNHDPIYWLGILAEELGEAAKETIELSAGDGEEAFYAGVARLRTELVQLAAVAVAAIECIDRKVV